MRYLKTLIGACFLFSSYGMFAQVGIGTDDPTNTLHVRPNNVQEEPLRLEGLKAYLQGDTTLLVVDPETGIVRYLPMSVLIEQLIINSGDEDGDPTNEIQNSEEVPLVLALDLNNDTVAEINVQEALEAIASKMPKGTFKSIGEARDDGLVDGDSFYTDPEGVFGCSGCIITLYPGME